MKGIFSFFSSLFSGASIAGQQISTQFTDFSNNNSTVKAFQQSNSVASSVPNLDVETPDVINNDLFQMPATIPLKDLPTIDPSEQLDGSHMEIDPYLYDDQGNVWDPYTHLSNEESGVDLLSDFSLPEQRLIGVADPQAIHPAEIMQVRPGAMDYNQSRPGMETQVTPGMTAIESSSSDSSQMIQKQEPSNISEFLKLNIENDLNPDTKNLPEDDKRSVVGQENKDYASSSILNDISSELSGIDHKKEPLQDKIRDKIDRGVDRIKNYLSTPEKVENLQTVKGLVLQNPLNQMEVTSNFGPRNHPIDKVQRLHKGVDLRGKIGDPVFSAGSGTVEVMGNLKGYGNYIKIKHDDGTYSTAYAHLNGFQKGLKVGSRVNQGDVIAFVGNTGKSTGPHLHYEVMKNGVHVDPLKHNHNPAQEYKNVEFKNIMDKVLNNYSKDLQGPRPKVFLRQDKMGQDARAFELPLMKAADDAKLDRGYIAALVAQESSFQSGIKAKTSTATGLFQFIDTTWLAVSKKYNLGYTLADKKDPQKNIQAGILLQLENQKILQNSLGIKKVPNELLYIAHFAGPSTAIKVAKAAPNTPASKVFSQAAISSNPGVFKKGSATPVKDVVSKFNGIFKTYGTD